MTDAMPDGVRLRRGYRCTAQWRRVEIRTALIISADSSIPQRCDVRGIALGKARRIAEACNEI